MAGREEGQGQSQNQGPGQEQAQTQDQGQGEAQARTGLVPYGALPVGYEGVYTGQPFTAEREDWPARLVDGGEGREVKRWPLAPWLWPKDEEAAGEAQRRLDEMQKTLSPLSDETRRLRAHIASLVPCDNGFPVTVDELLDAIGQGRLRQPSFHNGCMIPEPWWEAKTTQPGQTEALRVIEKVLLGYLAEQSEAELAKRHPGVAGFIRRTYEWLGPAAELSEVQRLLLKRALLPFEFFAKHVEDWDPVYAKCFKPGGEGEKLDTEIAKLAGLPKITIHDYEAFKAGYDSLQDPTQRELYRVCCRIAGGVSGLSDCHHNTFRMLESWIHGIGRGTPVVATRRAGAERERLARLLLGYVLGLDRWLGGASQQFVLLDLGHVELGFEPKSEILRVYAYLGEASELKRWLAGSLWLNLRYNRPAGLSRHAELIEQAAQAGVKLETWV